MSPEQARGEPATTASDMYSCGLLLQEIFTGRPPYDPGIDRATLLARAAKGETVPVTGIDPDLAALIGRIKSLAPAERPSARDTAERLDWIRAGRSSPK
jgi:serine/threonine protein kinase